MGDSRGVLHVGERFNPRYEACGFFPDEIVARRRDLTDGQKWLYSRMVRWARLEDGNRSNERAGEVWRAHETIANELGKSEKQVSRDLAKLESVGLLDHRQRDGRKSNTYRFLFHPEFERTSTSVQMESSGGFEGTPTSGQIVSGDAPDSHLNGHPGPVKPDLSGHPRPPNPKELNQGGSSSSPEHTGRLVEAAEAGASATAPAPALPLNGFRAPASWSWSDQDRDLARQAMQVHFGASMLPDLDLSRDVLVHMQGLDDVLLWLLDLTGRMRKPPKGWGFYLHDAQAWPKRRADVQRQVDGQRCVMEAKAKATAEAIAATSGDLELYEREQQLREEFLNAAAARGWRILHRQSNCLSCYGFGRRDVLTGELCDCQSGRKLARDLERCDHCEDTGMVAASGNPDESAWCDCVHAERLRKRNANAVEEANQVFRKLRDLQKPGAVGRIPARAAGAVRVLSR